MSTLVAKSSMTMNVKDKMEYLRTKAQNRKNSANLRHVPNQYDIKNTNENAKDLEYETYKSIKM